MSTPTFLASSLYVATGGAIGSWLRFAVGRLFARILTPDSYESFPWATLTVNVLGSIAMGVLVGILMRLGAESTFAKDELRLFFAVGLLGGFTTFSAFSLEIVSFFERGHPLLALTYLASSLLLGIAGLMTGLAITRTLG